MIQTSQAIVRETGMSYRQLCGSLALPYGTFQRWRQRVEQGAEPRAPAGPKKVGPLPLAELQEQIARLPHRTYRTAGTGTLYRSYQERISRRQLTQMVCQERQRKKQARRAHGQRITWHHPNVAWAMDGTEYERDAQGQKLRLVGFQDLASSFQMDPLVDFHLTGPRIAERLEALFQKYGAPLFLKRDNGSNLNDPQVDAVLAQYGVIPLNSPRACPRYNGAMENGVRILKASLPRVLPTPDRWELPQTIPVIHRAVDRNNGLVRPRLKGRSPLQFYQQQARPRWTLRQRHEIFDWLKSHAEEKMKEMEKRDQQSYQRAWRAAVLAWLRCQGLVTVSEPKSVTPFSAPLDS